MRIGVVTTSYPRSEGDHAGNFVAAHVGALRGAGHDVEVIGAHTIASDLFYRGGAPDELERGGVRTYVAAARFSVALTREVARRATDWDLVIAHWIAPSALAAVIGTIGRAASLAGRRSRKLPILAIAHGGDIHTLRCLGLLAPTLYALRARGVRLAFVSRELREVARAAAPRLARWLDGSITQPMGIDVARFAALRMQPGPAAAPATAKVLVIGRLVPVKGVDVAIAAMKLTTSAAQLIVAGDGPERARLEVLAATRRSISFVGAVDETTRDRLLAEATCVVIPSRVLPNGRSEGTPMIALEALAAGVPVIASAVGGLRELPGITRVRPDDPRALAAAIDRALTAGSVSTSIGETPAVLAGADVADLDWTHVSARLLGHALGHDSAVTTRSDTAISGNPTAICATGDTSKSRTA